MSLPSCLKVHVCARIRAPFGNGKASGCLESDVAGVRIQVSGIQDSRLLLGATPDWLGQVLAKRSGVVSAFGEVYLHELHTRLEDFPIPSGCMALIHDAMMP